MTGELNASVSFQLFAEIGVSDIEHLHAALFQVLLQHYLGKWIQERTLKLGNDLISLIVNAQIDGTPIRPERMFGMFGMLVDVLFGGLDTEASMMSFICRFLAEHPTKRQQLVDDPQLINTAVDELIRRHGVTNTARVVTEDFDFKGVPLKDGDQIQVPNALFGLDERRFADPIDVDLTRKTLIHAAFGNGPHRCPGSLLARTEIQVFLQESLKRIPNFRVKPGEQPRTASGSVNGVLHLPLVWDVN